MASTGHLFGSRLTICGAMHISNLYFFLNYFRAGAKLFMTFSCSLHCLQTTVMLKLDRFTQCICKYMQHVCHTGGNLVENSNAEDMRSTGRSTLLRCHLGSQLQNENHRKFA